MQAPVAVRELRVREVGQAVFDSRLGKLAFARIAQRRAAANRAVAEGIERLVDEAVDDDLAVPAPAGPIAIAGKDLVERAVALAAPTEARPRRRGDADRGGDLHRFERGRGPRTDALAGAIEPRHAAGRDLRPDRAEAIALRPCASPARARRLRRRRSG